MLYADLQIDTKAREVDGLKFTIFLFRKHHKGNFHLESKKIKKLVASKPRTDLTTVV